MLGKAANRREGPRRMESASSSTPAAAAPPVRPRAIAALLLLVAALVFAMVVVGGITRLTESGLSITEWKPITGAIPPLSVADWDRAFRLYQATLEYREINGPAGMTLAQFQHIYFWEWLHRLLGRLIGLAFANPLGWYMVMSGLATRTDVSHLRLSAHLLLALAIMGALIWVALDLRRHPRPPARLNRLSVA